MKHLKSITTSKHFKKTVILLFLITSAIAWFSMWLYGQFYVSTDDAYINANVVKIAPRITGKITYLGVRDNQFVKKDTLLFKIDEEPYLLEANSAKASLALSVAELDKATITETRVLSLVKKKYLSPQDGDNVVAAFKTAQAKLEQAKALLAQANLNLAYTHVIAPTTGWVTNVTLRVGDIVPANRAVFALISNEEFWVDANFKETEVAEIKPGQSASVTSDMYPSHPFKGVVESISGGAGAAFSLLPPQNATGNWVKVTQRVPVRIRILDASPTFPLRIGTSVNVTVNLRDYITKSAS